MRRAFGASTIGKRKPARAIARTGISFVLPALRGRVLAPVVAAAEAEAEPGRFPSPGSPSHPGTSASPEAAAEAEAEAAEAEAAEPQSCR